MRSLLFLAICICKISLAYTIHTETRNREETILTLELDPADYSLSVFRRAEDEYKRLSLQEGFNQEHIGSPEIPRIHKWLAVSKNQKFQISIKKSDEIQIENVKLVPVLQDVIDDGRPVPFRINQKSYASDKWIGENTFELGKPANLGTVSILPITMTPIQYNPANSELRVFRKVEISLKHVPNKEPDSTLEVSPFLEEQVSHLTLNAKDFFATRSIQRVENKLLIIAPVELSAVASKLAEIKSSNGLQTQVFVLPGVMSSSAIKKTIQDHFINTKGFSHLLLFGSAKKIPLYMHSGSIPGDAMYSFVSGSDMIADISVGRLPVEDLIDAEQMVNKLRAYTEKEFLGISNNKVLLAAHKENYPSKYTANMEQVRQMANPLHLEFTTQYGGKDGTSEKVVRDAQETYSIINYRGHGNATTWSGWGADSKSFQASHVRQFPDSENHLPFIFNIACLNAALQNSNPSLSYIQLFPEKNETSLKGAIGAIGATLESATEVNHRFNYNLFHFLQNSTSKDIGSVYTLSNNKLVQDNNGVAPNNVKMYLLLSDPTLIPKI